MVGKPRSKEVFLYYYYWYLFLKIKNLTFNLWNDGFPEVGMFCAGVTVLTAVAPPNTGAPWGPLPGFWTIWGAGANCRLCSEGEVTAATVIEFPKNSKILEYIFIVWLPILKTYFIPFLLIHELRHWPCEFSITFLHILCHGVDNMISMENKIRSLSRLEKIFNETRW